jgi:hypothetical protein
MTGALGTFEFHLGSGIVKFHMTGTTGAAAKIAAFRARATVLRPTPRSAAITRSDISRFSAMVSKNDKLSDLEIPQLAEFGIRPESQASNAPEFRVPFGDDRN